MRNRGGGKKEVVRPPLLHSSEADRKQAYLASVEVYNLVHHILDVYFECDGEVSEKICLDLIYHYDADILRHMGHHSDGVDPAKHIAYLVFWLRKLKPVSQAYYKEDINGVDAPEDLVNLEVHDINERVSIAMIKQLLLATASLGLLGYESDLDIARQMGLIEDYFDVFRRETSDLLHIKSDNFHAIIYDMRYRTFGPHHFTHIVNHIIYFVNSRMEEAKSA